MTTTRKSVDRTTGLTADETIGCQMAEIVDSLMAINATVEEFVPANQAHWGHVGSLGFVLEQLHRVETHLGIRSEEAAQDRHTGLTA